LANDPHIEATVRAYALRAFPYSIHELDPVRDDGDLELVCFVAGWEQVHEVGEFLAERAAKREPALVLVAGGSGTGRTSLANYLIRKWADGRVNFDRSKLIVASGLMSDFAAQMQLWEWVLGLWPQVLKAGFAPDEPTAKTFDDLRANQPQAMASALQSALMKLTTALHTKGWALAGILEEVKKQEILALARDAFRFVDALLVATVDNTSGNFDAVLSNVQEVLGDQDARTVILDNLQGTDVKHVVNSRWHRWSDHDPPFDDNVLDAGFAGRARPLKRVLLLMQDLLVYKQIEFAKDEQWPAARYLAFSKEEMHKKISYWEACLRTRK
jgi:hypothetical protein